jgi:hypothetical protein
LRVIQLENPLDLLAAVLFFATWGAPVILAYWKGTSNIRGAAAPLVALSFVGFAVSGGQWQYGVVFWLLAWGCAIFAIRRTGNSR